MKDHAFRLLIAVAAALVPSVAAAQHDAHQAAPASAADMAQCAQAQPLIQNIVAAATARLESARQSNNPADMRAAIDSLESALRDIRTQLAPCTAATPDPRGAHTMPGMQDPVAALPPGAPMDQSKMRTGGGAPAATPGTATGTKPTAPAAPMDHSKMPMGGGAPAAKPGSATGTKPTTPAAPMNHSKMPRGGSVPATTGTATGTKPTAPAAPMDHSKMPMGGGAPAGKPESAAGAKPAPSTTMDHSKMPMGAEAAPGTVVDPVNGLKVDPASAPKMTYQGQTYYFSSEQSKKEFLENPAKFAKKPKQ